MKKIMIVDDEPNIRKILSIALKKEGYEVACFGSGEEALSEIGDLLPDMIISDIRMDKMDGMTFFKKLSAGFPGIPLCFITAYGNVADAVSAIKHGAVDYLLKPFEIKTLIDIIEQSTSKECSELPQIIAASPEMKKVVRDIDKVAATDMTVLLRGETGVGKDLVANYIHMRSKRSDKPFVKVDCTTIPTELFESELFGHKKGAFTGAISDRTGKFELADGGTIFLDEIGTLNENMQKKLLRIIQEKIFVRIGDTVEKKINVRVICATNEDLEDLAKKGEFRNDLYFRIRNSEIIIPSLRYRREDIKPLIDNFFDTIEKKYAMSKTLTQDAINALLEYDYPGNIRELENILEQAYVFSDNSELEKGDVPFLKLISTESKEENESLNLKDSEIRMIKKALQITGGNLTRAAKLLSINRNQLAYKIEKYGLN